MIANLEVDMGWDKKGDNPWEGMDLPEQPNSNQPKKENRGWVAYHIITGIMLYAYAKASGIIDYLLGWIAKKGSDPFSAGRTASTGIALSIAFLLLGYYLSVRVVRGIHDSKYPIKTKGVLLALFPIVFIAGGLFIALGIRILLSN